MNKFRRYSAVIGDNTVLEIKQIAAAMDLSHGAVTRDLRKMIDSGAFLPASAIIDRKRGLFALGLQHMPEETVAAPAKNLQETEGSGAANDVNFEENERILTTLRQLKANISNESISFKIERIEHTFSQIFKTVREYPEKLPQIRKLMNYYLPTTIKLLESYEKYERQGISGENVDKTKADIDRILGKLANGFSTQLDQLYSGDALDIASDITVLENMMVRDGLSGFSAFGSASSAIAQVEDEYTETV
jgi:DNA-binding Lrp family transcriptional regulator